MASTRGAGEAARRDRGRDLGGIVREIVHHLDAMRLADDLETPADAAEARERAHHLVERDAKAARGGYCRERVRDVVRAPRPAA